MYLQNAICMSSGKRHKNNLPQVKLTGNYFQECYTFFAHEYDSFYSDAPVGNLSTFNAGVAHFM